MDGANLSGIDLSAAILYGGEYDMTFRDADLSGGNLSGLHYLDFDGAILTGAIMPDGSIHP